MDSFDMGVGHCWIIRAFGRNPLVRLSDRVEALWTLTVIVAVLGFVPVAGAVGTAVHETRCDVYEKQAADRHLISATAVEDSLLTFESVRVAATARVRWQVGNADHTEIRFVDPDTKAGDRLPIWVDGSGNEVSAPPAGSQATRDAALAAIGCWMGFATVAAALSAGVRRWLCRVRARAWDRDFFVLVDEDGGRTGQKN
jgi:hypothetical protein